MTISWWKSVATTATSMPNVAEEDAARARAWASDKPLQRQDEADRGDEVAEVDERSCMSVLAALRARPSWNIRSMRSVIRKPPTMLMVAQVTATEPRTVLTLS